MKQIVLNSKLIETFVSTSVENYEWSAPFSYSEMWETDTGSYNNPCYHKRWSFQNGRNYRITSGQGTYSGPVYADWLVPVINSYVREEISHNKPDLFIQDWDKLIVNHLETAKARDLSLINFILELDDVGKLLASYDPRKVLKSSVVSNYSTLTLGTLFGSLPFIGDLTEITKRLTRWTHGYKSFVKKLQPQMSRARHRNLTSFSFEFEYSCYKIEVSCEAYSAISGRMTPSTSDPFELLGGVSPGVAYALNTLGLFPDLGTLWNAVPFSWLADWVLPIGQALEGPPWGYSTRWSILDPLYTYKVKWWADISVQSVDGFRHPVQLTAPYFVDGVVLDSGKMSLSFSEYSREIGYPYFDGIDVPNPKPPNLNLFRGTVLSALLAPVYLANKRKPKNKLVLPNIRRKPKRRIPNPLGYGLSTRSERSKPRQKRKKLVSAPLWFGLASRPRK